MAKKQIHRNKGNAIPPEGYVRCEEFSCLNYFLPNPHPNAVEGRQKYCSAVCMRRASYLRHRKKHYPKKEVVCIGCKETYLPNSAVQKLCRTCVPHSRAWQRWHNYRLTQPAYDKMLAEQGGICAICYVRPVKVVDHDHKTGKVRGLLCVACNHAIGVFYDDPVVMKRAAQYVKQHRKKGVVRGEADPPIRLSSR